uniref:dual specificity protein phosphatase 8-like isoform X3 n=1 Tax=Myxine glutinosa TaxID=7769 RepID=UPI00358EAED1
MVNCGQCPAGLPLRCVACAAKKRKSLKLCAGAWGDDWPGFSASGETAGSFAFSACYPGLYESREVGLIQGSISQPCLPVSSTGPTRILPHLYLGSQADVLDEELMAQNGITYVLNASNTCPQPDFIAEDHFLRVPVNDSYCEKILPWLDRSVDFIDKVKVSNCRVVVHCLAGISRSATLAIAYVMKHHGLSSDDAYRFVKEKRPSISPNFNFLGQLLEFEKVLCGQREANRQGPAADLLPDAGFLSLQDGSGGAEGISIASLPHRISTLRLSATDSCLDGNRLKRSFEFGGSVLATTAAMARSHHVGMFASSSSEDGSKVSRIGGQEIGDTKTATIESNPEIGTDPPDPLASRISLQNGDMLRPQLWLNLASPSSSAMQQFPGTWRFPDSMLSKGTVSNGGTYAFNYGGGPAEVRLRSHVRLENSVSGTAGTETPRRSWHEGLSSVAEKGFKRRSCQLEFEEGLAAEVHGRDNLPAIIKRSSFSGSMEIIEVS